MQFHALADLFPLLEGDAFEELCDDISIHGLVHPIVTLADQILDGRNRWRACQERSVEPRFVEFAGADPVAFVVSTNLRRRHLTDSQRAMIAARIANHPGTTVPGVPRRAHDREGTLVAGKTSDGMITKGDAAKLLNVSDSHVRMAREVVHHAPPEKIAAVDRGEVKLGKVWTEVIESRRPSFTGNRPGPTKRARAAAAAVMKSCIGCSTMILADGPSRCEACFAAIGDADGAAAAEDTERRHVLVSIRKLIDDVGLRRREIFTLTKERRIELVLDFARALGVAPAASSSQHQSLTGSSAAAAVD